MKNDDTERKETARQYLATAKNKDAKGPIKFKLVLVIISEIFCPLHS